MNGEGAPRVRRGERKRCCDVGRWSSEGLESQRMLLLVETAMCAKHENSMIRCKRGSRYSLASEECSQRGEGGKRRCGVAAWLERCLWWSSWPRVSAPMTALT